MIFVAAGTAAPGCRARSGRRRPSALYGCASQRRLPQPGNRHCDRGRREPVGARRNGPGAAADVKDLAARPWRMVTVAASQAMRRAVSAETWMPPASSSTVWRAAASIGRAPGQEPHVRRHRRRRTCRAQPGISEGIDNPPPGLPDDACIVAGVPAGTRSPPGPRLGPRVAERLATTSRRCASASASTCRPPDTGRRPSPGRVHRPTPLLPPSRWRPPAAAPASVLPRKPTRRPPALPRQPKHRQLPLSPAVRRWRAPRLVARRLEAPAAAAPPRLAGTAPERPPFRPRPPMSAALGSRPGAVPPPAPRCGRCAATPRRSVPPCAAVPASLGLTPTHCCSESQFLVN